MRPAERVLVAALLVVATAACTVQKHLKSNALDYLYPAGTAAVPPGDVTLRLPVRVGIAFAPAAGPRPGGPAGWQRADTLAETTRQKILVRIADAFREKDFIASVEVIPRGFLSGDGGFEGLDKVKAAFGIDLIALVSYDQFQFSGTSRGSFAYLTILGAYVVKGEKNDTQTMLDAVVYNVASRTLLFTASGQSGIQGSSTPVDIDRTLRKASEEGFDKATDDLIAHLETALASFKEQAARGTVRGPGTPAIAVYDASGEKVVGGGGGAFGVVELAAAALLAGLAAAGALRGRRA